VVHPRVILGVPAAVLPAQIMKCDSPGFLVARARHLSGRAKWHSVPGGTRRPRGLIGVALGLDARHRESLWTGYPN
jgi:hypothetical protein